jgi:hypothetical protein
MVGIAPLRITEYLKAEGMKALIEQRVARGQEQQVPPFTRDHDPTLHRSPEESLRLDCVEFREHFNRSHEIGPGISEQAGNLVQDSLDLPSLSRKSGGKPVVEFDDTEGLDE